MLAEARRRRFRKNEVIFHEGDSGDSLHVIAKGHVAIRATTPLGDVATFTVYGPGQAFGEQALLGEQVVRTASAVALEATETQSITRTQFDDLRAAHPTVDRFLVHLLADQVRRLSAHLTEALYVPVEVRLVRRLLSLAEQYPSPDGGPIVIPLTQDDIATMAGTTRPTANRALKVVEDEGVIAIGRGRIELLDLEALARRGR